MREHPVGRLHVVSDARDGRDALGVVAAAVAAGAPVVQVRAKGCTDRVLYDFARRVVELCTPRVTCIVNDRVDVALAVGAAGTHLGADDLPMAAVRQVAGPGHLIGGTARDPERAAALVAEGADYLGVGPAYSTVTKTGLPAPLGPRAIGAVAAAVDVPVIAIGGVAPSTSRAGGGRGTRGGGGDGGLGRGRPGRGDAPILRLAGAR